MAFRDTLDGWSSSADIRGAAVVSEDGLLVHETLPKILDGEAVAALAVALLRGAAQFAHAAGGGTVGSVVVELTEGPAIVVALDDRHTLVVLAYPDRDLGPLLFDIRRDKPRLSRAV